MYMRVMHITCRLHMSSPLRNVLCVYSVWVFNACMPIRAQIRNYWGRIRNFVKRSEIRNNYEFFVMVGSSENSMSIYNAMFEWHIYNFLLKTSTVQTLLQTKKLKENVGYSFVSYF